MKVIFRLLTQLSSRRSISYLVGRVAKSRFSKRLIPYFIHVYKIDVSEAERPPEAYPHLNAFFTRRLKPGVRPIHPGPHVAVSPVDGTVTSMGIIRSDGMIVVKGKPYSLAEMLQDQDQEQRYRGGYFLVLYLSPRDYHRIHAPIGGRIVGTVHHRGTVYPVNPTGLQLINGVLAKNERLITYIEHDQTQVAVIKVGAMNVASIRWSDRLRSTEVIKGEELAYFEFGSTVVLLFEPGSFALIEGLKEGDKVKMGQPIGYMNVVQAVGDQVSVVKEPTDQLTRLP